MKFLVLASSVFVAILSVTADVDRNDPNSNPFYGEDTNYNTPYDSNYEDYPAFSGFEPSTTAPTPTSSSAGVPYTSSQPPYAPGSNLNDPNNDVEDDGFGFFKRRFLSREWRQFDLDLPLVDDLDSGNYRNQPVSTGDYPGYPQFPGFPSTTTTTASTTTPISTSITNAFTPPITSTSQGSTSSGNGGAFTNGKRSVVFSRDT